MGGINDVNHRDFFSDENMNSIGTDAEYADWAPGPNEDPSKVTKGRPMGDTSVLSYDDIEYSQGG